MKTLFSQETKIINMTKLLILKIKQKLKFGMMGVMRKITVMTGIIEIFIANLKY